MPLTADDRMQILELIARYNRAHDSDDTEGWLDTFTDDAVFVTSSSTNEGRRGLRHFFVDGGERIPGVRHVTYNSVIEAVDGDPDRARMQSDLIVLRAGQPPEFLLTGSYDDTLRRSEDGWRFERREVRRDA